MKAAMRNGDGAQLSISISGISMAKTLMNENVNIGMA